METRAQALRKPPVIPAKAGIQRFGSGYAGLGYANVQNAFIFMLKYVYAIALAKTI